MPEELNTLTLGDGELRLETLTLPNGNTYTLGCSFEEAQDIYDVLSGNIEAVNEELESTFTATVEKDGESAGTASLCFKIFDENAEEIEIVNLADATSISPVSEVAWEITVSGHVINLWYEVDAESGTCHIMASTTLTDEGEPFVGSAELYVKCEEE